MANNTIQQAFTLPQDPEKQRLYINDLIQQGWRIVSTSNIQVVAQKELQSMEASRGTGRQTLLD